MAQGGIFAAATTALLLIGLTSASCGPIDNLHSRMRCNEYCTKKASCEDEPLNDEEDDACVIACRDAIEDECGNEHQDAANDKIGECVDMGCSEFAVCMVFDAAPECFGFVND